MMTTFVIGLVVFFHLGQISMDPPSYRTAAAGELVKLHILYLPRPGFKPAILTLQA